jgi:hypothetical protein
LWLTSRSARRVSEGDQPWRALKRRCVLLIT